VDAKGRKATTNVGSFKTLQRTVAVHFTRVSIIDDSDGGLSGSGDLKFVFRVHGQSGVYFGDFDDGDEFDPNAHFLVGNAPEPVTLDVLGVDDDGVGFASGLCHYTPEPGVERDYSSGDCDWASGVHSISLQTGLGESGEQPFSFPAYPIAESGSDLTFTVHGTVVVSYQ
jgi:hypothetical protein